MDFRDFDIEGVASVIFDPTVPPRPDPFAFRLAHLFIDSSAPAPTEPRRLNLREARSVLMERGISYSFAHELILLAGRMAAAKLHILGSQRLGIHGYCPHRSKDLHYSENAYLGLAWLDSQPDLKDEPEFIQQSRALFVHTLNVSLDKMIKHVAAQGQQQAKGTPANKSI